MLYAFNSYDEKVLVEESDTGFCPGCKSKLVARKGVINIWHWAHKSKACDFDIKPETVWHLGWKKKFPKEWCEVPLGRHRADVLLPSGRVIEFQSGYLSYWDATSRLDQYKKIIWILDGNRFSDRFHTKQKEDFYTFKWKYPRKFVEDLKGDRYIDFTETENMDIFEIQFLNKGRGWGRSLWPSKFLFRLIQDVSFEKQVDWFNHAWKEPQKYNSVSYFIND